jgi:hypothetical protein
VVERFLQTLNVQVGKIRRERMNGRSYIVAPFVSLGPRVLNGSKGALYYPRDEIEANPGVWNNIPLTLGHPVDPVTNFPVSASDPGVKERIQLGHIHKDRTENGWRKGEAWFDEELTKNKAPEVYEKISKGEVLNLSTGLYTDNEELQGTAPTGQHYDYIARNYRPDHLAILPNQDGACSPSQGCGINMNSKHDSRGELVVNKSFWHRLGEAFGMTFNDTTPLDIGGAQQPQGRHGETGEFLPKGARLGEKQFQTAAERGFSHLIGGAAPKEDIDDDGDADTPEFGEGGGRVEPGIEMDHLPLPTDRGPKKPTGNDDRGNRPPHKPHFLDMGEEDEGGEATDNTIDKIINGMLEEPPGDREVQGTGMSGSPLHIGPTAPAGGGTQNMGIKFFLTNAAACNMSHDDIRGHLQGALNAKTGQDKPPPQIHEVHDDHVIYHDGNQHQKQGYEPNDKGDGIKLTGKPVPVKPVTKFEPVQNREAIMALSAQQRQEAVRWLTANCDCHKGKAGVLNNKENYSDEDLIKLIRNALKARKNENIIANARNAGITLNEKAESSSADQTASSEVDANDSPNKDDEEEEMPMYKKKDISAPKKTLNQYLSTLPPEMQVLVKRGLAANNARKSQLIGILTRNYRNPAQKQAAVATLNQLTDEQLEVLAGGLPPMMQPAINQRQMGVQPVKPVYGPEMDEILNQLTSDGGETGDEQTTNAGGLDVLPMPTQKYLEPAAGKNNRQRA